MSWLGENRRKGLPLWIREQLEKIEHQKEKELEREAEAARQAEHTGHSSWRDELDDDEDDLTKTRQSQRKGESGSPIHQRHANYRSHSSNKVSIIMVLYCVNAGMYIYFEPPNRKCCFVLLRLS